jgi:hypothetical protein
MIATMNESTRSVEPKHRYYTCMTPSYKARIGTTRITLIMVLSFASCDHMQQVSTGSQINFDGFHFSRQ